MDFRAKSIPELTIALILIILSSVNCEENSVTCRSKCCLWSNSLCECRHVYLSSLKRGCAQDITNFSLLDQANAIDVDQPKELDSGMYALFILDSYDLNGSQRILEPHLVYASINIDSYCLINTTNCSVTSHTKPTLPKCDTVYDRFDSLRVFLIRQSAKFESIEWLFQSINQTIDLPLLYNRSYFRGPPARTNQFFVHACHHAPEFDHYLQTKSQNVEKSSTPCGFDKTSHENRRSTVLIHFPRLSLARQDIWGSLFGCELNKDWLLWPKMPLPDSSYIYVKECEGENSLQMTRRIQNEGGEKEKEFIRFLLKMGQRWFNLLRIEWNNLLIIEQSSTEYYKLTDSLESSSLLGSPKDDDDESFIHPDFCHSFKRQFKKVKKIASRAELYSVVLRIMGHTWYPDMTQYES